MDHHGWQELSDEAQRVHAHRGELVTRIARATQHAAMVHALPGVCLFRESAPREPTHGMTMPAFCVIAQGSKIVLLGDRHYRYDPAQYLLTTAELPYVGQIIDASPTQPYLALRLELDPSLVGSVLIEAGHAAFHSQATVRALDVSPMDADLMEAVVRLVRLLDTPRDVRFLAPLLTRELIYRLLMGVQGDRLRQIALVGGATQRIASAIARIRTTFDQPLRIESLAGEAGMSRSTFHQHFKAVTAMSPVQFQKHLRLQEARRLMVSEHLDATRAGARVGYADTSQFTREYKRLFGTPPAQDTTRLRDMTTTQTSR